MVNGADREGCEKSAAIKPTASFGYRALCGPERRGASNSRMKIVEIERSVYVSI
jgi:hypothetical protein